MWVKVCFCAWQGAGVSGLPNSTFSERSVRRHRCYSYEATLPLSDGISEFIMRAANYLSHIGAKIGAEHTVGCRVRKHPDSSTSNDRRQVQHNGHWPPLHERR